MKNIFKKITSTLFLILILPLFVSSFIFNIDVNVAEAQCSVWTPGSDVWYAQGCDQASTSTTTSSTPTGGGCTLAVKPKFNNLVDYVVCIINLSVIPLIFSLAFMLFVYGVVQYVLNDTDGAKRQQGKQFMIWGIIALTVMVSVWGLVKLLGGSFGLNTSLIPQVSTN